MGEDLAREEGVRGRLEAHVGPGRGQRVGAGAQAATRLGEARVWGLLHEVSQLVET